MKPSLTTHQVKNAGLWRGSWWVTRHTRLSLLPVSNLRTVGPRILVVSLSSCRALTLPSLSLTSSLTLLPRPSAVFSWQRDSSSIVFIVIIIIIIIIVIVNVVVVVVVIVIVVIVIDSDIVIVIIISIIIINVIIIVVIIIKIVIFIMKMLELFPGRGRGRRLQD